MFTTKEQYYWNQVKTKQIIDLVLVQTNKKKSYLSRLRASIFPFLEETDK